MKNRIFIAVLVFAVFTLCFGAAQQVYKTLTLTENGTVAAPSNFILGLANGGTGGTNAITARQGLGLPGAGPSVQGSQIFSLSWAPDVMLYSGAAGTNWSGLVSHSYGRGVLTNSSAGDMRAYLGLGNIATNTAGAAFPAFAQAETLAAQRLAIGAASTTELEMGSLFPPALPFLRLAGSLRAGGSDAIQILGDSISANPSTTWISPALTKIGQYVGSRVRIVHLLNTDWTGQGWAETVVQEGTGRPYWENQVGYTQPAIRSVSTNDTPTLSGDLDIRFLLSTTDTVRSGGSAANGYLMNFGGGGGAGSPIAITLYQGGAGTGFRVETRDSGGTDRFYQFNGVCNTTNLGGAGALYWLRVQIVQSNGSNSTCKLEVSKTSASSSTGLTWTQLGTTQTSSIMTSWDNTSISSIELLGRQTSSLLTGVRLYKFELRSGGIGDGTAVVNTQVPHCWSHNYLAVNQTTPRDFPTLWVINSSVAGGSLNGLIGQTSYYNSILPKFGQSVVYTQLGTNDANWITLFLGNLAALKTITDNRFANSAFIVGGEPPVRQGEYRWTTAPWTSRQASQFGANVGRGYVDTLLRFEVEMAAGASINDLIGEDLVHPTTLGYALIKEAFLYSWGIIP